MLKFEEDGMSKFCNICATCVYPIADCEWLHKGKPVEGWTAEPSMVMRCGVPMPTYHITGCPKYIPHPRMHMYMRDCDGI